MIIWNPLFRLKRLGKYSVKYFYHPSQFWDWLKLSFSLFHGGFDLDGENYRNEMDPMDCYNIIEGNNVILGFLDYVFPIARIANYLFMALFNYIDRKLANHRHGLIIFIIFIVTSAIPMISLNLVKPSIAVICTFIFLPVILFKYFSARRPIKELERQMMKVEVCEITPQIKFNPEKIQSFDPILLIESQPLETLMSQWKGNFYSFRLVAQDKKIEDNIPENVIILQKISDRRMSVYYSKDRKVKHTTVGIHSYGVFQSHLFPTADKPDEVLITYNPAVKAPHNRYVKNLLRDFCLVSKGEYQQRLSVRLTPSPRHYPDLILYVMNGHKTIDVGLIEICEENVLAIQAMLKANLFLMTDYVSRKQLAEFEGSFNQPSRGIRAQRRAFCDGLLLSNQNPSPIQTLRKSILYDSNLVRSLFEYSGHRKPRSEASDEEKSVFELDSKPVRTNKA